MGIPATLNQKTWTFINCSVSMENIITALSVSMKRRYHLPHGSHDLEKLAVKYLHPAVAKNHNSLMLGAQNFNLIDKSMRWQVDVIIECEDASRKYG